MDLKEFVKQTITDIIQGVEEAKRQNPQRPIYFATSDKKNLQFDVAVMVENVDGKSDTVSGQGASKITVLGIGMVGTEISGTEKSDISQRNSTVSRIKFDLMVSSLNEEENRKLELTTAEHTSY